MDYTCTYTTIDCVETGKKLAALMELHFVDVKNLANSLGVSNQAVYKWINGQSLPSLENMFQISRILQVSIDDIIVATSSIDYRLPEIYVREDSPISYYN